MTMKLFLFPIVALGLALPSFGADETPAPATFKDARDKQSYSFGANIGSNLKLQSVDFNLDEVMNGLRDGMAGKAKLNPQEIREILMAWQQDLRTKMMAKQKVEGETNKKAGDDFLAANAKKAGVKSFSDGLQYKVLTSGKGPQAKPSDSVSAHYKGTLTDGTEFDSSYTRGRPLVSPVMGLIPGWQEALTNMHVGDKWELYIPGNLAYGERGSPPKIGANALLIFEMELLGIEPPPTNAPPAINLSPGTSPIRPTPGPRSGEIKINPSPSK